MSSPDPPSPAAEKASLPKFQLEYASSGRSKCKDCSHMIDKGVIRLGIAGSFRGKEAYGFRHWGCITDEVLAEIQQLGNLSEVSGYNNLHADDQIRLSKAVEAGHVSTEDRQEQRERNKATDELETKKQAQAQAPKEDEKEKRERKKSKKRKETEETEPKAKKKKKAEDSSKNAATTKEAKKPTAPTDVVPDSEDEASVSPKRIPVKKPQIGQALTPKAKAKAKASPKKSKEKSSKKADDAMDVDKDGEESADEALSKAKSKSRGRKSTITEQDEKTSKQPAKSNKKAADDDSKTTSAKAAPKEPAKPPPKATTATKAPAKEAQEKAPIPKTGKSKASDTEAQKPVKAIPKNIKSDTETSDRAPSTPRSHPNNAVFLDVSSLLRGSGVSPESSFQASTPRPQPPPRFPLPRFCKQYKLSSSLQEKMAKLDIDGPHVLRLIKDSALQDAGFSIGEVAGLRDAEERWIADSSK